MKIETNIEFFYPIEITIETQIENLYLRYFPILGELLDTYGLDDYPISFTLEMHETQMLIDSIGKEVDTAALTRFAFDFLGEDIDQKLLEDKTKNVYLPSGSYGVESWRIEFIKFWDDLLECFRKFLTKFHFMFAEYARVIPKTILPN